MTVACTLVGPESLGRYAQISIAFLVDEVVDTASLRPARADGLSFQTRPVVDPYTKDYDALPGASPPQAWREAFDLSTWGLVLATDDGDAGDAVGGAAVAPPGSGVVSGVASEAAMLWDLRVAPSHRGRGLGAALFSHALQWARSTGAGHVVVETQDTNVGACRFYRAMGCDLLDVRRGAYAGNPVVKDEVMLLWSKSIEAGRGMAL